MHCCSPLGAAKAVRWLSGQKQGWYQLHCRCSAACIMHRVLDSVDVFRSCTVAVFPGLQSPLGVDSATSKAGLSCNATAAALHAACTESHAWPRRQSRALLQPSLGCKRSLVKNQSKAKLAPAVPKEQCWMKHAQQVQAWLLCQSHALLHLVLGCECPNVSLQSRSRLVSGMVPQQQCSMQHAQRFRHGCCVVGMHCCSLAVTAMIRNLLSVSHAYMPCRFHKVWGFLCECCISCSKPAQVADAP